MRSDRPVVPRPLPLRSLGSARTSSRRSRRSSALSRQSNGGSSCAIARLLIRHAGQPCVLPASVRGVAWRWPGRSADVAAASQPTRLQTRRLGLPPHAASPSMPESKEFGTASAGEGTTTAQRPSSVSVANGGSASGPDRPSAGSKDTVSGTPATDGERPQWIFGFGSLIHNPGADSAGWTSTAAWYSICTIRRCLATNAWVSFCPHTGTVGGQASRTAAKSTGTSKATSGCSTRAPRITAACLGLPGGSSR